MFFNISIKISHHHDICRFHDKYWTEVQICRGDNTIIAHCKDDFQLLYNTNFSRGGNFRYIREFGFCAKFSSRENNIHCEWNFAKFSSREIFLPRNFPPHESKFFNSGLSLYNMQQKRRICPNSSLIVGITGIR